MSTKRKKKPTYIYRVDDDQTHTHGYRVRLRVNGKTRQRLFSDRTCKGRAGAKQAAGQWRDEVLAEKANG